MELIIHSLVNQNKWTMNRVVLIEKSNRRSFQFLFLLSFSWSFYFWAQSHRGLGSSLRIIDETLTFITHNNCFWKLQIAVGNCNKVFSPGETFEKRKTFDSKKNCSVKPSVNNKCNKRCLLQNLRLSISIATYSSFLMTDKMKLIDKNWQGRMGNCKVTGILEQPAPALPKINFLSSQKKEKRVHLFLHNHNFWYWKKRGIMDFYSWK